MPDVTYALSRLVIPAACTVNLAIRHSIDATADMVMVSAPAAHAGDFYVSFPQRGGFVCLLSTMTYRTGEVGSTAAWTKDKSK